MWAAVSENADVVEAVVRALVAAGVDVRARDRSGRQAAHFVALNRSGVAAARAVKALAACGVSMLAEDERGSQPLHHVALGAAATSYSQLFLQ